MASPRKRRREENDLERDCVIEAAGAGVAVQYPANSKRLKARSEMLATCLDERWAGQTTDTGAKVLSLDLPPNISCKTVKHLLHCIHKDQLPEKCRDNPRRQMQLLVAADYLQSTYCTARVLEQLICLVPDFTWKQWQKLQQVLEQLVELPEEPRARLEAACATWLTTQLSDLDDVVGPALCSPYQLAVGGQVGGEEDWRCHLLKQLSVQELLSVIQAAQPRCPYQTTVVAAISVWADARARQQQQEMQQAEGEEVEEVEGSAASLGMTLAEALQLAGAVRLAGLPRSLLPCLQQLPWWSATVSPEMQVEGHSMLLIAADSLISLAPFKIPTPETDRHNGMVAVLKRVRDLADKRGRLPPPLLGWLTPPVRHNPGAAITRLDLTASSSLLAWAQVDAVKKRNDGAWRQLDQVCWAGLVWRVGCRWVAFTAPLEGAPLAAAPAARRTRQQAAQQEREEGAGEEAGGGSSWEDWALDVDHLAAPEAEAALAGVAAECWGLQVCVVCVLPGVDQLELIMDPPVLVSPGARLAPGERRAHVYQRKLTDPSRGTIVVEGGKALVVQQVVPLLEVVQQLTDSQASEEAAGAEAEGAQEQDKAGGDGQVPEELPAQDEEDAEVAGLAAELQLPALPAGSITLQLELGPLH